MPDNGEFQRYYLRRIGVVTPLPTASSDTSASVESASLASEAVKVEEGGDTVSQSDALAVGDDVHFEAGKSTDAVYEPAPSEHYSSPPAAIADILALRDAAMTCTDCVLSESRTQVVFGVGAEKPDVVFIGEAPGEQEDKQGEPFVGRAGQLLDRMLAALNWSRSNVYIMNVIKCRPPGNRNPHQKEVQACSRWFDAQWQALTPKLVCLLGRVAAQRVLGSDASLSSLRGRWHEYRGVPVWVTYHPAYLLRSPSQKSRAWQDFRLLAERSRVLKSRTGHVE